MASLTIAPQGGASLTFSDVSTDWRGRQAPRALRGAPTQEQLVLSIGGSNRIRLPELEAIAVTRLVQQVNRAGVYQVVSGSEASLCTVTWDILDRSSNPGTIFSETMCGVVAIGEASLEGSDEQLSIIIYRCDRLVTPSGVQVRP